MTAELAHARSPFTWTICGRSGGLAYRQSGAGGDLVLLHGLGMSSAYFMRFAQAMFERGWNPIAPDIRGFGASVDAPAGGPLDHARGLIEWADAVGCRKAVWLGHSISCNVVAHIACLRPDLVRAAVFIGPLWTRKSPPLFWWFATAILDGLREPLELFAFVGRCVARTGGLRWLRTWSLFRPDLKEIPPVKQPALFVGGRADPLPDRDLLPLVGVPGAHACLVSHPSETAEAVTAWLATVPAPI